MVRAPVIWMANTGGSINASQTGKSFLVLSFKKEQKAFFLKKEAKTFIYFRLCKRSFSLCRAG
jgi:hypothetical protein